MIYSIMLLHNHTVIITDREISVSQRDYNNLDNYNIGVGEVEKQFSSD